ncbi:Gamma-aminobutyric acid type B receptor subunit 2, partial [Trichoplax sp. H2]
QKDVRIILYVGFTIPARQLICQAYRKGYYGSRYVWWFPGWFRTGWWKISDASFNCTTDELFAVIRNSSFYTSAPIYSSSNTKGISGKTGTQFFNDLNKSLNYTFKSSAVADTIGGIYDAVWSLALGLNRTEHQLLSQNSSLNEFNYHNQKIRSVLVEELNKLSFYGVTGPISFKNGSSRLGDVIIWQLQDGKPPQDRLIVIVVINTITAGAFIPFSIISCLGIVFSFVIIGFIVIKRHNRYIKMSSPNLNYFILFGCILCYASVMVNGMDSRLIGVKNRKYTCVAKIWFLSLGFTIAFGSVMLKSWRIFKIFTNVAKLKMIIKDRRLIILLAQMVLIDILILILWNIIDPIATSDINIGEVMETDNKIIRNRLQVCTSKNWIVWLIIILIYKSVMLLYGVSLAWRTRKVSINSLNDSRSLALTIYNIFVLSFTGVIIGMVSNDVNNVGFALKSTFIILCTTSSICLVFIPKLLQVKVNPPHAVALTKSENKLSSANLTGSTCGDQQLEIRKLRLIVKEQEEKLIKFQTSDQQDSQRQSTFIE